MEDLNTLAEYLTPKEMDSLSKFVTSDEVDLNLMRTSVSISEAKNITNTLFANRKKLQHCRLAVKLFSELNKFYDESDTAECVTKELAGTNGMNDRNLSYRYESPY